MELRSPCDCTQLGGRGVILLTGDGSHIPRGPTLCNAHQMGYRMEWKLEIRRPRVSACASPLAAQEEPRHLPHRLGNMHIEYWYRKR